MIQRLHLKKTYCQEVKSTTAEDRLVLDHESLLRKDVALRVQASTDSAFVASLARD